MLPLARLWSKAHGAVCTCPCTRLNFFLALKILNKKSIVDQKLESQIVQDIIIHNMLLHPNMEFLANFIDDPWIFLGLEYCGNEDPCTFLER
jgi:hypothetical protein